MKKLIKRISIVIVSTIFISNLSISTSAALTGNLPSPVIGTAQGFYPNKEYVALGGAGAVALEAGESLLEVALYIQLLPKGSIVGTPCVATSGTRLTFAAKTTSALNLGLLSAKWTNPADSVNQVVCALYQATTTKGIYSSPAAYALIGQDPNAVATVTATPTPTASVSKPTISKPAFATSPKVGVKAKATIKKVNLNGNEFKSRSVTLYVCDKSDCSDKTDSNATKYSDLKDTDAKTITMPEAKGKKGQYVVLYDRVVYGADLVVEKASSIKQLSIATSSASASPTASEEEVVEETPEASMEEIVTPTPEATPVEAAATSSSISMGLVLGVIGALVIALLIVIIVLLARKKK